MSCQPARKRHDGPAHVRDVMTTAVTCISPEDVDVDTGMVILTGVAGDAAIIRAAGELAGRVAGSGRSTNSTRDWATGPSNVTSRPRSRARAGRSVRSERRKGALDE